MNALHQLFADARGYRDEAKRARKFAETASGQLQSELLAIAALYDLLADGKDPDEDERRPRPLVPGPGRRSATWRRKFFDWNSLWSVPAPEPENG